MEYYRFVNKLLITKKNLKKSLYFYFTPLCCWLATQLGTGSSDSQGR